MEKKVVRPRVELLWLSTVDQGRQLEVNSQIGTMSYPLATVVADEQDESLWLELYVDEMIIQIPVATVQEALTAAPGNVHSEAWYEANGYYESGGLSSEAKALAKRNGPDGT
jgi:hypothetical protein